MKRRVLIFIGIPLILAAFFVTSVLIFQDNIGRFLINPRTPFQAINPPKAPDYITQEAWLLWPDLEQDPDLSVKPDLEIETVVDERATPVSERPLEQSPESTTQDPKEELAKSADIFYIHGTTYDSRDFWNAPLEDEKANTVLRDIALPNEIGPFAKYGEVFAPRYRQATLFTRFTHKYDSLAASTLAYQDVRAAFEHYLSIADQERPLVLVGYDQGGLYITGLLQEFILHDQRLKDRLAAIYVIRYGVPISVFDGPLKSVPPCLNSEQTACLVSFNPFENKLKRGIEDMRKRTLIFDERSQLITASDSQMVCINPLSWKYDENYVPSEEHSGGASASGLMLDQDPPLVKKAIGAKCEEGVLILDEPKKSFLKRRRWFGQQWRAQPFNLFYGDLREDVKRRLDNHAPVLAARYRQLDPLPIEDAVELTDSPIKKVPR